MIKALEWKPVAAALAVVLVGGCSRFPQDIENTRDRVEQSRMLRVGLVAAPESMLSQERALGGRVAAAHGASLRQTTDTSEILIRQLDEGDLDLVIGQFATKSPWSKKVALTNPADGAHPPKREPALRAAVKAGENGWLMTVNRDVGGAQ